MSRRYPPAAMVGGVQAVEAIPTLVMNQGATMDPVLQTAYAAFLNGDVWLEWFGYDFEWNPLAADASGQQDEETIDPDVDFLLRAINLVAYSSEDPTSAIVKPNYVMEIQEKSGRTNYSNTTMHVANFTGSPQASSYELPCTRYIRGNNAVVAKLTNRTAVEAVVNMEFLGWRMTYLTPGVTRQTLYHVPY